MSLRHPETQDEHAARWACLFFVHREIAPLIDRLEATRRLREAHRCAGVCGGEFATRAEKDSDGEVVHFCDVCTMEDSDAAIRTVWSWSWDNVATETAP